MCHMFWRYLRYSHCTFNWNFHQSIYTFFQKSARKLFPYNNRIILWNLGHRFDRWTRMIKHVSHLRKSAYHQNLIFAMMEGELQCLFTSIRQPQNGLSTIHWSMWNVPNNPPVTLKCYKIYLYERKYILWERIEKNGTSVPLSTTRTFKTNIENIYQAPSLPNESLVLLF